MVLWPVVGLLAFDPHAAIVAPPEITVTITGAVGLNGWYTSNVTVDWQVDGETSSSGCDTVTLSADTPGTTITCTAANGGDQTIKSVTIKLDKTAPSAGAAAERPPDSNGWYTQPLTVSSSGQDDERVEATEPPRIAVERRLGVRNLVGGAGGRGLVRHLRYPNGRKSR